MEAAASGGGGGEFCGIDADLFGQLVKSMQTGTGNGQQLAGYYLARFDMLGVDTGAVTRLRQDYNWAQGQQPMLQRRLALAAALDQAPGNYFGSMTTAGAGDLQYRTSQAAKQAGAKAAKEYENGKISFNQFMRLLGNDDPDFNAGAIKQLGTNGLRDLESQISEGSDPTPQLRVLAAAVAGALANGDSLPLTNKSSDGIIDWDLLANLVAYATFPTGTLVSLAQGIGSDGVLTDEPDQVKAVLTALAGNPQASAEYMNQFPKEHDGMAFAEYVSGANPWTSEYSQLYANVITAGTIGAKTVDPGLAAQNVTSLVQYYSGSSPIDATPAVQLAYAKIVASYWSDVQGALTDPAYAGSPDGVSLSANQWLAFVRESMQDSTAAVNLLHFSATEAALLSKNYPNNPEAQHASIMITGLFGQAAQTVYQDKMNQLAQAQSSWDSIANLFVGIAIDPEGAVGAVATAAVSGIADSTVHDIIYSSTPQAPPNPVTWQQTWQQAVAKTYVNHPGLGDPAKYAQEYKAKPFLTSDGTLVPNASVAQQQAYNAWLKDQTVANASDAEYQQLDLDRFDSQQAGAN